MVVLGFSDVKLVRWARWDERETRVSVVGEIPTRGRSSVFCTHGKEGCPGVDGWALGPLVLVCLAWFGLYVCILYFLGF